MKRIQFIRRTFDPLRVILLTWNQTVTFPTALQTTVSYISVRSIPFNITSARIPVVVNRKLTSGGFPSNTRNFRLTTTGLIDLTEIYETLVPVLETVYLIQKTQLALWPLSNRLHTVCRYIVWILINTEEAWTWLSTSLRLNIYHHKFKQRSSKS
jgi:hypothetical protein